MFTDNEFKSESEINKFWTDHLDSLEMWGGDVDVADVRSMWEHDLATFRKLKDRLGE